MVAPTSVLRYDERHTQLCPNINGGFVANSYYVVHRDGHKQKPPYTVDTPLFYRKSTVRGANHFGCDGLIKTSLTEDLVTAAANKARAKFVSKIGDASQFGSTLTSEFKSTYGTVVTGVATALRAARYVAKGKLGEAGRLLGFSPPVILKRVKLVYGKKTAPKGKLAKRRRVYIERYYWQMPDGRSIAKSLANKWLWYSYGVKPLIDDLYNASKVFVREVPGELITEKGYAGDTVKSWPDSYEHHCNVKVSAYVRVTNPNLWLANQLGLINPVQMVNEGIMFSFVIDWFSNWSDWLQQLTDFVGLEIAKPNTIVVQRTIRTWSAPNEFVSSFVQHQFTLQRTQVIPDVKLRFAYERFQWQRGANAVSLLVQFLRSSKA